MVIYLAAHTDFNEYKKEGNYVILAKQDLNKEYQMPVIVAKNEIFPMRFGYSELYMIWDIYCHKNYGKKDKWIGLNHYRRYFENVKEETTLPTPIRTNLEKQYAACHNLNDLKKCEQIIDEYFHEYSMNYSEINEIYPCNMFIMKYKDFEEYCKFVFGVLSKFNELNNLHTDDDVLEYVKKNHDKGEYGNNPFDAKYQARLQGFLAERLGTIFFLKHFKKDEVAYRKINIVASKIKDY